MTRWRPDLDLDRLLDALEAEILAATDQEIRLAFFEAGCSIAATAGEVRKAIADTSRAIDQSLARARAARQTAAKSYLV